MSAPEKVLAKLTINGLAPNNTECGEWPMNKNGKYTLIFEALAEKLLKPHDLWQMPQSTGYGVELFHQP